MFRDFLGAMTAVAVLVAGMMLEGCVSGSLQLGAGIEKHDQWGHEPSSVIRFQGVMTENNLIQGDRLIVEADHHSSIPDGVPFGGKDKNTADQVSVVYEIPLWGKK